MVDDNDRRYDERREAAGPRGRVGNVDHAFWQEQMKMDRITTVRVICMECKAILGMKDGVSVPAGMPAETHGTCPDCDAKIRERQGLKKRGG